MKSGQWVLQSEGVVEQKDEKIAHTITINENYNQNAYIEQTSSCTNNKFNSNLDWRP